MFFRSVLSEHVDEILKYAARHGCDWLIDEMALLLLQKRLDEIAIYLPDDLFKRWVLYYQMWVDLLQYLRILNYGTSCGHQVANNDAATLRKLGGVESLQNLDLVFSVEDLCCEGTKATVRAWQKGLERLIQAMPRFSDPPVKFVGPPGGLRDA